jgi:hypothetical protein
MSDVFSYRMQNSNIQSEWQQKFWSFNQSYWPLRVLRCSSSVGKCNNTSWYVVDVTIFLVQKDWPCDHVTSYATHSNLAYLWHVPIYLHEDILIFTSWHSAYPPSPANIHQNVQRQTSLLLHAQQPGMTFVLKKSKTTTKVQQQSLHKLCKFTLGRKQSSQNLIQHR